MSTRVWLVGALALTSAVVLAHEVPVEQRVEMTIQPRGDRLAVRMRIPSTLVGNAPIEVAAADAIRNLDLRQHETPLDVPVMTAALSGDRTSLDLDLTYR